MVSIDAGPVIEVAHDLAERMGVADRVELVVGDIRSIDADAEFDLAVLVHVAQYLDGRGPRSHISSHPACTTPRRTTARRHDH